MRPNQARPGKKRFSNRIKAVTSTLAVASFFGIWNGVGHFEARSANVVVPAPDAVGQFPFNQMTASTTGALEQPLAATPWPPVAPRATSAPIPTLALPVSIEQVAADAQAASRQSSRSPINVAAINLPAIPSLAALPALDPLPALPSMPALPVVHAAPSNGSSNQNSSQSSSGKKTGSS